MSYNSVEDYVKNAESNRNSAVLNSLLESEPGMKELPEITAEDEGKFLQVNNGKPSWSSSGSSGGVYTANITWSEDSSSATLDKTWQEIYDACAHGPVFLLSDGDGRQVFTVYSVVQMLETGKYSVSSICGSDSLQFEADTNTGYPVFSDNK